MKRLLAAVWIAAAAGCGSYLSDTSMCPESRTLRCITPLECSLDDARGCRVCQCAAAGQVAPATPNPLPTDRNQGF